MSRFLVLLCLVASCKKGDACEQVMNKLRPLIAKEGGEFTAQDEADGLARCREQLAKTGKPDRTMQCILDSDGSEAEVGACITGSPGEKEAQQNLRSLEKKVKTYFVEMATLPAGSAPLTPAVDCCQGEGQSCPKLPRSEWDANPAWKAISFHVDERSRYRYSYESDGKTQFTARAVGDLDCDGSMITYELRGKVVEGNVVVEESEQGAD